MVAREDRKMESAIKACCPHGYGMHPDNREYWACDDCKKKIDKLSKHVESIKTGDRPKCICDGDLMFVSEVVDSLDIALRDYHWCYSCGRLYEHDFGSDELVMHDHNGLEELEE